MTVSAPVYSDAQLIAELRRVAVLLPDGPLTSTQFATHGRLSTSTVLRRFGSWRQALTAAGLVDRYSGRTVSTKMRQQRARRLSNRELVDELRQVPARTGRPHVTGADLQTHSTVSKRVYLARFGSWPAALAAAGLTISPRGQYWSDEELAANLRHVIQVYGRTPTSREMDRSPSTITYDTYRHRFGNLARAREVLKDRAADGRETRPAESDS